MIKYTVDRVEDGIAVLEKEDLSHVELKVSEIPFTVKEGNVLLFDEGKFILDFSEEEERRKTILEKQRNIFKKT